MSTILRVGGENFDVDVSLQQSTLAPCKVFRRGKPKCVGSKQLSNKSGFNLEVSEADFNDFEKQIKNAVEFLKSNEEAISKLTEWIGVESMSLDFGVSRDESFAFQSITFPNQLLKLAGNLGVDIEATLYPISEGET